MISQTINIQRTNPSPFVNGEFLEFYLTQYSWESLIVVCFQHVVGPEQLLKCRCNPFEHCG